MKITLQKQECNGTCQFNGQIVYTRGMAMEFGADVIEIFFKTLKLIQTLTIQNIADYFQVAYVQKNTKEKVKIYIIDDIDHVTFLLPDEY